SAGPWGHRAAARAHGHLRASDADREQVIEFLKTAFVQGRLTIDELDARAGQALVSRTYGELALLTVDIPSRPVRALPRPPAAPVREPDADPVPEAARTPASVKAAVWAPGFTPALPGVWPPSPPFYGGLVILSLPPFAGLPLIPGPPRARERGTMGGGGPPAAEPRATRGCRSPC